MKVIIVLLLILPGIANSYFEGYGYEDKCAENYALKLNNELNCVSKGHSSVALENTPIDEVINSPLFRMQKDSVMVAEAKNLERAYEQRIKEFGDFSRYLRGVKFSKNETSQFRDYESLQQIGLSKIIETNNVLIQLKEKLRLCGIYKCSISWRIDLEKQIQSLETYSKHLRVEYPLLASEHLEEKLQESNTINLRYILRNSLGDSFSRDLKHKSQVQIFKNFYNAEFLGTGIEDTGHLSHPTSIRTGNAIDLILANSFQNWNTKDFYTKRTLCSMATERVKIKKSQKFIKNAVKIGLVGISLIPIGFAYTSSVRGLRAYSYLNKVSIGAQIGVSSLMLTELNNKMNECKTMNSLFVMSANAASFSDWQDCLEEESSVKSMAILSVIPYHLLSSMPSVLRGIGSFKVHELMPIAMNKLKRVDYKNFNSGSTSYLSLKNKESHYSFLNLLKLTDNAKDAGYKIADDYWKFAIDVYQNRLKLSPKELKEFLSASRELNDRTKLIISSKGTLGKGNMKGGVAITESSSALKPLPLELETGFNIQRDGQKIVEISRFTSITKDKQDMKDILIQMGKLVDSDKDIGRIVVFTSKIHHRLYKSIGLEGKIIHHPSSRDVIFELTPEQVVRFTHQKTSLL